MGEALAPGTHDLVLPGQALLLESERDARAAGPRRCNRTRVPVLGDGPLHGVAQQHDEASRAGEVGGDPLGAGG